jgi:hypothetical protein
MNKQELEEMLNSGMSMNSISKHTEKSLSTIRYWCKKFQLNSRFGNFKNQTIKSHYCDKCGETNPQLFSGHKKSLCTKCSFYNFSKYSKYSTKYVNVKEWRKNTKLKLFEGFGGKCSYCGIIDDPIIYDFHHLIPSEKEFVLTGKIRKWDSLLREVKKCTMLCGPCHRKLHAGTIELQNITLFEESNIISYKSP